MQNEKVKFIGCPSYRRGRREKVKTSSGFRLMDSAALSRIGGNRRIKSTQPSGSVLLLLGQRQWPLVEQQRVQRQLLVIDVELSPQRTEPELQQWRG